MKQRKAGTIKDESSVRYRFLETCIVDLVKQKGGLKPQELGFLSDGLFNPADVG